MQASTRDMEIDGAKHNEKNGRDEGFLSDVQNQGDFGKILTTFSL